MVNVQRYILGSFFLLNFGGKNSRLSKKNKNKNKKPPISCRTGGEVIRVLRINSLEKTNENNVIIFSSTFIQSSRAENQTLPPLSCCLLFLPLECCLSLEERAHLPSVTLSSPLASPALPWVYLRPLGPNWQEPGPPSQELRRTQLSHRFPVSPPNRLCLVLFPVLNVFLMV